MFNRSADKLERIENKYNPENDISLVSWQDMELVEVCKDLLEQVEILSDRVEELEAKLEKKDG